MNVGIDMVYLHSPYYEVQSIQNWHQRTNCIVGQELNQWGTTLDGQPLTANSYYINRGVGTDNVSTIELSPKGLTIQFNPSVIMHPFELTSDIEAPLNAVQNDLDMFTVTANIDTMTVSRLDLTKQAVLTKPFSSYSQAFSTLRGKRMKGKHYDNGYSIGNGSRRALFYDKSVQLISEKDYHDAPRNLGRCEATFSKNRTVSHTQRGAGIGTLKDLREASPESLTQSYNRFLLNTVFNFSEGNQLTIDFSNEIEILRMFREGDYSNPIGKYERMEGLNSILERFGSFDIYADILREAGYNSKTVYRRLTELKDLSQQKAFIDNRRGANTILDTVYELRDIYTRTA